MERLGQEQAYRNIEPLLRPKSITIVGASERPNSWAARIFRNLRSYGFPGEIHLVNPRHRMLYGAACFPSVLDVPDVDQMVVIVPAQHVASPIEQGGSRGARSAVVFSGGFSETGEASGIALEREVLAAAARYGVLVCGPNCLGNVSTREKVLTFAEHGVEPYSMGGLALVSQSSGIMGGVTRHAHGRGLGLSYGIASGTEANVDSADYLNFLAEDSSTGVIGLILESIRRPAAFAAACQKAQAAKKPILILKLGKSTKGREAVLTHTGALAGSYDAFVAFARKYGLIEIHSLDELVDTAEVFLRSPLPRAKGVAAISLSGGGRGYLCDLAEELKLSFPEPSPTARAQLQEILGVGAGVGNPLDLGAAGASDPEQQLRCVELLASDPSVGLIALQAELPQGPENASRAAGLQKIVERAEALGKPIIFFSRSSYPLSASGAEERARWNAPFLQDIRRSFQAIGHVTAYGAAVASRTDPGPAPETAKPASAPSPPALADSSLPDPEAFSLLEAAGVAVACFWLCDTREQAVQSASQIGYPVALKASVTGLTHKSQSGGVWLNLQSPEEVAQAFDCIQVAASKLKSSSCAVLVQEMVRGVLELYVGGRWDREFGPLILFGFGGQFVEDLARVSTRLAPVEAREAEEMIVESGVGRALRRLGLEETKPCNPIIEAIVRMSQLIAASQELDTIEVNPLLFRDASHPCVAVDVVAIRKDP